MCYSALFGCPDLLIKPSDSGSFHQFCRITVPHQQRAENGRLLRILEEDLEEELRLKSPQHALLEEVLATLRRQASCGLYFVGSRLDALKQD